MYSIKSYIQSPPPLHCDGAEPPSASTNMHVFHPPQKMKRTTLYVHNIEHDCDWEGPSSCKQKQKTIMLNADEAENHGFAYFSAYSVHCTWLYCEQHKKRREDKPTRDANNVQNQNKNKNRVFVRLYSFSSPYHSAIISNSGDWITLFWWIHTVNPLS